MAEEARVSPEGRGRVNPHRLGWGEGRGRRSYSCGAPRVLVPPLCCVPKPALRLLREKLENKAGAKGEGGECGGPL